jgi:hypothetical protein
MDRLKAYRTSLVDVLVQHSKLRTCVARKKFDSMFLGWWLGSSFDTVSGFPLENIVSVEDVCYIGKISGFTVSDEALIQLCANVLAQEESKEGFETGSLLEFSNHDQPLRLHSRQLKRLASLYSGVRGKMFQTHVSAIRGVYGWTRSVSSHFGVPPEVAKRVFSSQRNCVELFGTPLNTWTRTFCSPLPELERVFGSLGRYSDFLTSFTSKAEKSLGKVDREKYHVWFANPPFASELTTNFVAHLISTLRICSERGLQIVVYVFLPMWDDKLQSQVSKNTFTKGVAYPAYNLLTGGSASSFFVREDILDRDTFSYYDYFRQRAVRVGHTTLHSLCTTPCKTSTVHCTVETLLRVWRKWSANHPPYNVQSEAKEYRMRPSPVELL